jgi:peptidoglycan/LPS O-acetylase OafA/YrhL
MWLAHHYPEDYDRCVVIGRSHVCRRCLALYPLTAVVLAICLVTQPGRTAEIAALAVLSLPATVELVLEQLGVLAYSARRQVGVTLLLALGLGSGFAAYLDNQLDPAFWGIVVLYTSVCLVAVVVGRHRSTPDHGDPPAPRDGGPTIGP